MRPLSANTLSYAPKWRDNPTKYPAIAISTNEGIGYLTTRPFQIDLLFLVNCLVGFLAIFERKKNKDTGRKC